MGGHAPPRNICSKPGLWRRCEVEFSTSQCRSRNSKAGLSYNKARAVVRKLLQFIRVLEYGEDVELSVFQLSIHFSQQLVFAEDLNHIVSEEVGFMS